MNPWPHSLKKSLHRRWKQYRKALQRCQDSFSENSVHQFRVETRKLLATMTLLADLVPVTKIKKAKRTLKRQLDVFSDLRDTQVQIQLLQGHQHRFPEARPLMRLLAKKEARALKEAKQNISKVSSGHVTRVIRDLEPALKCAALRMEEIPAPSQKAELLKPVQSAFHAVTQLKRSIRPNEVETLHRMRVAFKTFRYMMETLAPLFPSVTQKRLSALRTFQTRLGTLQDTEVFLQRLLKYTHGHRNRESRLNRLRLWLLSRLRAQTRACLRHAHDLDAFWPIQTSAQHKSLSQATARRS